VQKPQPPIATVLALMICLSACSGDDGIGTPRTINETDMSVLDSGVDARTTPDPIVEPVREACGGTNTGEFVSANLDHQCAQETSLISLVTFFECAGCSSPLICTDCAASPRRYAELNLHAWDEDLTGKTLTQDNAYLYLCRIAGACEEVLSFAIRIDTHVVGECVSGSYLWVNPASGAEETGTFDAAGFGPPSTEEQDACR
jgi:hypothetical protein